MTLPKERMGSPEKARKMGPEQDCQPGTSGRPLDSSDRGGKGNDGAWGGHRELTEITVEPTSENKPMFSHSV